MAVAPIAIPCLTAVALSQRWSTSRRRRRGDRPRLFWGPQPIIIIRDWSKAMRSRGYVSHTFVNNVFAVHNRSDYDGCRQDRYWPTGKADTLKAYLALAEALMAHDVFHFFFDGGLLSDTPLWMLEPWLLKLAGKKFIVSAYGLDIAVPGHLGLIEEAMVADYPWVVARADQVRRKVDHLSRTADLVIGTLQPGYLPRYDFLWINQFAVDVDSCPPAGPRTEPHDRPVHVIHAPNHRALKGTPFLIEAVEALQREGVRCELEIVEKVHNDVLRARVSGSDIVVDQLVIGFGYFALESLCAGKPVVSNIDWMPPEKRSTPSMLACPMVDANPETIGRVLRRLVEDEQLRESAGKAGRQWIVHYHSLEAVGAIWDGVIGHVWHGAPLPSTGPQPAGS